MAGRWLIKHTGTRWLTGSYFLLLGLHSRWPLSFQVETKQLNVVPRPFFLGGGRVGSEIFKTRAGTDS